ncbi:MAG: vWA domain-containing protein [Flavobacteriia bacterium]|jgi:Ca-activated chloride channel family protein
MFKDWNIAFWEYDFLSPYWLWLLALVPALVFWMFYLQERQKGEVKFSRTVGEQQNLGENRIKYIRWFMNFVYGIIFSLLIIAFARPSHWSTYDDFEENYKNGIDIVLAMDISTSMLARDFQPNRLEASKKVAKEFIDGRKGDRIGLVAYEGEAYTACPSTLDYEILKTQIDQLQPGMIEGGTAIGLGLGTAVTRLRNDSLPSKVIILLSDGVSESGDITPEEAAELARAKNIRVYTIGVGSMGMAPSPIFTPFGIEYMNVPVEIDEITMNKIATITGGKYFRATNEESLRTIYKEIEKLEKRRMKDKDFKSEPPVRPAPFLNWALLLLMLLFGTELLYFKRF